MQDFSMCLPYFYMTVNTVNSLEHCTHNTFMFSNHVNFDELQSRILSQLHIEASSNKNITDDNA